MSERTHFLDFVRALLATPIWQEMQGHTHSLDTLSATSGWQEMPVYTHRLDIFWKSTVSHSSLTGNARSHSHHPGHILRKHYQPLQFDRKCQAPLTHWRHFERALRLSASSVWQEMPRHTHFLDTFWESTVRQSSLTGNARTHSLSGHIVREHSNCQPVHLTENARLGHTHFLDTFWESTISQSSLIKNARPDQTHILNTFWESTVSQGILAGNTRWYSQPRHILRELCQPLQFGRKRQGILTYWTHFERALSATSVWQEMPDHTHSLDTFWENTINQSSLTENARSHSQTGHISTEHC